MSRSNPRRRRRYVATLAFAISLVPFEHAAVAAPVPLAPGNAAFVGSYDGGQMELAAGLELRADGRFQYALSYGALDEEAQGHWTFSGNKVLLTSVPVSPPRFQLLERQDTPEKRLLISLDPPPGMSRQYFDVLIMFADGGTDEEQFAEGAEPLAIATARPVASIALQLPVFELRSDVFYLAGPGGHRLRFRFEPNDLGKVAFSATPLQVDHDDLILVRHDRSIRFRRTAERPPSNS